MSGVFFEQALRDKAPWGECPRLNLLQQGRLQPLPLRGGPIDLHRGQKLSVPSPSPIHRRENSFRDGVVVEIRIQREAEAAIHIQHKLPEVADEVSESADQDLRQVRPEAFVVGDIMVE